MEYSFGNPVFAVDLHVHVNVTVKWAAVVTFQLLLLRVSPELCLAPKSQIPET